MRKILLLLSFVTVQLFGQFGLNYEIFNDWDIDVNNLESFYENTALTIPTYDAAPNIAHPSVLYFDDSLWNYKYWMAFTPYPAEARENPSIVTSNNGVTWDEPIGLTNPIVPYVGGSHYNSDVDLVYNSNTDSMYLVYRFDNGTNSYFYYYQTDDGVTWGNKTQMLQKLTGKSASPTLIIKGNYKMWYVDLTNDPYSVKFIQSNTLAGMNTANETTCVLPTPPTGYHIWHIEIRYSTTYRQYICFASYTTIGVPPNNGGKFRLLTSNDGITWNERTAYLNINSAEAYRGSFVETDYSRQNGAIYELIYNQKWDFRRTLIYKKSDLIASPYDGITTIASCYSFKRRLGNWTGLPTARIVRSSDGVIRDIYPDGDSLVIYPDTGLMGWANGSALELDRLYNQADTGNGDYIRFVNRPLLTKTPWNGNTNWSWIHDGSNDYGLSFVNYTLKGLSIATKMNTGRLVSHGTGVSYFGISGAYDVLLFVGSIQTLHEPSPFIYSGFFGNPASIRKNGVEMVTGTTNNPSSHLRYLGATPTPDNYSSAIVSEFITYSSTPSASDLATVENQMIADYPYVNTIGVIDSFVDVAGTLVTAHIPNVRVGSNTYAANDVLFEIKASNKLGRISAGTGVPTATIETGISDGFVSVDITPGGSGGSGIIYRFVDNNNFCYARVFNGTTLGIFRYVGGSFQTQGSVAIPNAGSTFTIKIKMIGTSIYILVNGTQRYTYTESNFATATKHGVLCSTAEPTTVFDNLRVESW